MSPQQAQACLQDRQLGDAAQVELHAGAAQVDTASCLVEDDIAIVHQPLLVHKLGAARDPGLGRIEIPAGERADGDIEGPPLRAESRAASLSIAINSGATGTGFRPAARASALTWLSGR